jgi:hypothetical protein
MMLLPAIPQRRVAFLLNGVYEKGGIMLVAGCFTLRRQGFHAVGNFVPDRGPAPRFYVKGGVLVDKRHGRLWARGKVSPIIVDVGVGVVMVVLTTCWPFIAKLYSKKIVAGGHGATRYGSSQVDAVWYFYNEAPGGPRAGELDGLMP